MSVRQRLRLGRRVWLCSALAVAVLALTWTIGGPNVVQADGTGTRLALNATGAGVSCDESQEPTECVVPLAASFTLAVEMIDPPDGGYVAVSSQVSIGGLTWVPRAAADENVWPDNALPVRSPDPPILNAQVIGHGGLTGTTTFPPSHHAGNIAEITLTCSAEEDTFEVALINYDEAASPLGASHSPAADLPPVPGKTIDQRDVDLYNDGTIVTVPVTDLLDISCEEVPPTPTQGPPVEEPAPTATPGLPTTGYGDTAGYDADSWLIVVLLVFSAAVLGLFGWRSARRSR